MHIAQMLSTKDTIRELSNDELELATNVFFTNLNYKPGESILIITDSQMLEQEAALWFEGAKNLAAPVTLIVLENMTHSGQEPPAEVVDAAAKHDISLFQTYYSLTHTQAGKAAAKNNRRGASLPGADYKLITRTLNTDYRPVQKLGEQLKQILAKNKTLQISSESGTDISTGIRTNAIYNDAGFFAQGDIGNLPAGETFFAPLLGSTNGTVIIDGSIADDVLDEPITIEISNGVITTIEGGTAAKNLEKKLSQFGKAGRTVAEIGIGTNPAAQISNNLLEAEKAYGTVHIAFGNSSAIGGENDVPIHIDGLISTPTVQSGEQVILEDRKFNLP